jgi:ribosome-binding factor A
MGKQLTLATKIRDILAPVMLTMPQKCTIVTITEVELSSDSQYATVYISALQEPKVAITFLEKNLKKYQHALRVLHIKRIPQLRFILDPRTERGSTIENLLAKEQANLDKKA